jgi:hypothetical protein
MKYDITFACGHEGTIELFGTNANREYWLSVYEKERICPECYKHKQVEEVNQFKANNQFPELVGSMKQIAWAEKVRRNTWNTIARRYSSSNPLYIRHKEEYDEHYKELHSIVSSKIEAKWWIENSDSTGDTIGLSIGQIEKALKK